MCFKTFHFRLLYRLAALLEGCNKTQTDSREAKMIFSFDLKEGVNGSKGDTDCTEKVTSGGAS